MSRTEPPSPPDPAGVAGIRYGYFVVQAAADRAGVSGTLENLATGERLRFGSTEELAALVGRSLEQSTGR